MQKNNSLFTAILIVVLVIGGWLILTKSKQTTSPSTPSENRGSQNQKQTTARVEGYEGNVIAGESAPYLEFNKQDYDKALSSGKLVFLNFYANWCPICRAEAPELTAGFNELPIDKIIGFQVNYNDPDTDEDERALAKQFGVTYQHTKILIFENKEVSRSTDQWDKERFLTELAGKAR